MKSYHICVLALLLVLAAAYKNNTNFWAEKLNDPKIHFQAYSGTSPLMQASKKLIGIILRARAVCSIIYSELPITTSWSPPMMSHFLFGFKADQEAVLNLEHSPKSAPLESTREFPSISMLLGICSVILYLLTLHSTLAFLTKVIVKEKSKFLKQVKPLTI